MGKRMNVGREGDNPVHEYALTKRIVQIVNGAAAAHSAARVSAVYLVVGENSGILPDSVQMYFDMIARGTPGEGAALHMRTVRPEMRCPRCGVSFVRPRFSFACPACGALGVPTDVGNEFYVERAELDIPD